MRFFNFTTPAASALYAGLSAAATDDLRRGRGLQHQTPNAAFQPVHLPAGSWLFMKWQNTGGRAHNKPQVSIPRSGLAYIDGASDAHNDPHNPVPYIHELPEGELTALEVRGAGCELQYNGALNLPAIGITELLLLSPVITLPYAPNAKGEIAVRPKILRAINGEVHTTHYPSRLKVRMQVRGDVAAAAKLRQVWERNERLWCWTYQGVAEGEAADWAGRDILRPVVVTEFAGFDGQDGTAIGKQGAITIAETTKEGE